MECFRSFRFERCSRSSRTALTRSPARKLTGLTHRKMSVEEFLPPNFIKLDKALRSIGYSFEVAVADIVDNSVDAQADHVIVRLLIGGSGHLDLAIWDDGGGMSQEKLKEAMVFGADVTKELQRLGKFGLGLKLASLSQAKSVYVVSLEKGALSGRAWLEHGIAKGFSSTVFDRQECEAIVREAFPDRKWKRSGTIVRWSGLYRIGHHHEAPDEYAQKLVHRLRNHLALAFHRFLGGRPRKMRISLDIFDQRIGQAGIPVELEALDPFSYGQSGHDGFPANMVIDGEFAGRLRMKAHVWPPNSGAPGYKLPGGANSRQGFYFYRNNRLIQGGGWSGLREAEPHASLARLEVDIDEGFDLEVSLDVKKVEIQLPANVVEAIQKARTPNGIDFKKYLSMADQAYRTRQITEAELPLIPTSGLPKELIVYLQRELRHKATKKHRDLRIQWDSLEDDEFFRIDRDEGRLFLNRSFRKRLLHGLPGSAGDVPIVKCLLFLVLEEALTSERMGAKLRERVEQVNRLLLRAIKYERLE